MNKIIFGVAVCLISFSYLIPIHYQPWSTFNSEILTILGLSFLLLNFYNKELYIPKIQLYIIPIACIPILQFVFGLVLYFSNAILCTIYILAFGLSVIMGFNLANTNLNKEKIFTRFCLVFLIIGLISSFIAICQWLGLAHHFSGFMYSISSNRPFANMGQPNNLATLLTIALLACLYFYEMNVLKKIYIIPVASILIFTIALTQSRTSWVVCLFILLYWILKSIDQTKRLRTFNLLLWCGLFVLFISLLPIINQVVMYVFDLDVKSTPSALERASSGYLRLDMWTQMVIAMQQQPWFGYGWNQTSAAQFSAFDFHPSREWYKSCHNIILDLLAWNGIPFSVVIFGYIAIWLYWLNKGIKDHVSMIAMLMIGAVLIHGMLELPLHYAYFLLLVGFLLGIIQAQYTKLDTAQLKSNWILFIFLVFIATTFVCIRDYNLYGRQAAIASQKTPITKSQQLVLEQKIWLLTQFEERIWWLQLDPKTKMTNEEIKYIERIAINATTKYDVFKYAQILAYNGYKQEAEHQLWIASQIYKEKRTYEDLFKTDE